MKRQDWYRPVHEQRNKYRPIGVVNHFVYKETIFWGPQRTLFVYHGLYFSLKIGIADSTWLLNLNLIHCYNSLSQFIIIFGRSE